MPTLEPEVIPDFHGEVSVAHHSSIFVLCYYMSLRSEFRVVINVRNFFRMETMFGSSLPLVVYGRVRVLFTLFVFVFV